MSFAPGHISLTFAIHNHADPLKMGSTGLGIVLPKGVYCSIVDENNEGEKNTIIIENKIGSITVKDQGIALENADFMDVLKVKNIKS